MVLRFRTDIPEMKEDVLLDWMEHAFKDMNFRDILKIYDIMKKDINNNLQEQIFLQVHKMCDKCKKTYPEAIVRCEKCGNDRLRSFRVHNNLAEMVKAMDRGTAS